MSSKPSQINWKRYWGERDGAYHIDRFGFLEHTEYYKDSFEFNDLRGQPCLLLLGEPGIGKSYAVREAASRQIATNEPDDKVLYFDLRSYGSEDRLYRSLFESDEVKAWREGTYRLHLFLDSLDECLLRVDTVAGLLFEEFRKAEFPRDRMMLRIACRTADLPPLLETELFMLWDRMEKEGIYELCPLQRKDVAQAAAEAGVNAEAFVTSVIEKGMGTLAARPVTLRMLLNLYSRSGEFPKSPVELYEAGCRALCDEPNESRRGSERLMPVLSPDEALLVAARIAAFTVLCNRAAIWTGMETGEERLEDILVRDIVGGNEEFRGITVQVNEESIRAVLKTGLFTSRGANRQGWSHQTFAEYLAAWYLNQRNFELDRLLSLVTNAADAENKPPPQLGETLSWLASMRSDVSEHLLKTDPALLLRSDAASFTSEFKSALVNELMRLFVEEELFDDIDLHSYYSRLKHPGIAEQLRPYIVDKQQSLVVRRIATDIAQECEARELQNELIEIVLDEQDNFYVRINAGYALWKIADADTKAKLRDLALTGSPNDQDHELKGVALLSVWPEAISADELFNTIEHPFEGFFGAYSLFLGRFVPLIAVGDLPRALQWVRESYADMASDFTLKSVMDEIVVRAEQHLDNPAILDEFSQTLALQLRTYSFREIFSSRKLKGAEGDSFLATDGKRKAVLQSLSQYTDGGGGVTDSILRTGVLRPKVEDLPWLLEQLGKTSREGEAWFFARLVGAFFGLFLFDSRVVNFQNVGGIDPTAFSLLHEAVLNSEIVGVFFGEVFKPVNLASEQAIQQKEWFATARKRQKELEDHRKSPPLLDPPPSQRVEEFLQKVESGELTFFWGLSQTLTLEPDSQHYGHWADADVTDYPGWKSATLELRTRLIDAAKRYVVNGEPENDKWVGTTSYQNVALAGYHALYLLSKVAPEFVELLSPQILEKWAPVITLFPLYHQHEKELDIHQNLIKKAYQSAPEVVLDSISKQIDLENTEANAHPALSNKFEGIWDERFRARLREQLGTKELSPALRRNIIRELLIHKDEETEEIALRPLVEMLNGDEVPAEDLSSSAVNLAQHVRGERWAKIFWQAVSMNTQLGRTLVETVCHFGSPASHLSEADAASFFVWLEEQYPHKEDPPTPRGSFVGVNNRQEIARWRDSFLNNLVNRGTVESVKQLERLMSRFPELEWLKRYVVEAKAVTRRNIWQPLRPDELFNLIEKEATGTFASPSLKMTDKDIDELIFAGKRVGDVTHLGELLRRFRDRPSDFVFFIGAGLSVPLFPSWPSALKSLMSVRYEHRNNDQRRDELQQMFENDKYLEVADICAKDLGAEQYRRFLVETFGKEFVYDDIPNAYRELLELAPQTILTTNYDRVPDIGADNYQLFSYRESPEATIAVQQFASLILKVHGTVTAPESIVFTTTEYQDAYQDGAFKGLLEAVIRTKYVVFLGFSFTDPYFTQIVETVFATNRRLLCGKYALLEGLSPTHVEGLEGGYGLSIIPYFKSDGTHPEVVEFIRLLAAVRNRLERPALPPAVPPAQLEVGLPKKGSWWERVLKKLFTTID
jgi:predicted NACHT family NTPase